MDNIIIGIDISKLTFDVALLKNEQLTTKKFTNNTNGFSELKKWLGDKKISNVHACMEATGCYGAQLAEYLYSNNFKVSVVNPARIKGFAQSKLCRVKTDKADCKLIAQFCNINIHKNGQRPLNKNNIGNKKPKKVSVDNSIFREIEDPVGRFQEILARKKEARTLQDLRDPYY